jgi:hypothetical protein
VARNGVIDGTVVFEVMVKPSSRIDGTRMVESHGLVDMRQQKAAAAKIGRGNGHKKPGSLRKALSEVQESDGTSTARRVHENNPVDFQDCCVGADAVFLQIGLAFQAAPAGRREMPFVLETNHCCNFNIDRE